MKKIILAFMLIMTSTLCYGEYDRSDFGIWSDSDHNCMNTRQEILKRDSLQQPLIKDCKVETGYWEDPYSGNRYLFPQGIDIDHIIPLKYAYDHGASTWSREEKIAFGNDPENLLAVSARENRVKGDKGPFHWLPTRKEFHCEYVQRWLKLSTKYKLVLDPLDKQKLLDIDKSCQPPAPVVLPKAKRTYKPRVKKINK